MRRRACTFATLYPIPKVRSRRRTRYYGDLLFDFASGPPCKCAVLPQGASFYFRPFFSCSADSLSSHQGTLDLSFSWTDLRFTLLSASFWPLSGKFYLYGSCALQ